MRVSLAIISMTIPYITRTRSHLLQLSLPRTPMQARLEWRQEPRTQCRSLHQPQESLNLRLQHLEVRLSAALIHLYIQVGAAPRSSLRVYAREEMDALLALLDHRAAQDQRLRNEPVRQRGRDRDRDKLQCLSKSTPQQTQPHLEVLLLHPVV